MSGDHNQYQKPDGKCRRCGEVNPAYIHTCSPQPVGWIYEDDEGRMIFSQMPHPDPLWEPVYRKQK
jgi:hypothetical protein